MDGSNNEIQNQPLQQVDLIDKLVDQINNIEKWVATHLTIFTIDTEHKMHVDT